MIFYLFVSVEGPEGKNVCLWGHGCVHMVSLSAHCLFCDISVKPIKQEWASDGQLPPAMTPRCKGAVTMLPASVVHRRIKVAWEGSGVLGGA